MAASEAEGLDVQQIGRGPANADGVPGTTDHDYEEEFAAFVSALEAAGSDDAAIIEVMDTFFDPMIDAPVPSEAQTAALLAALLAEGGRGIQLLTSALERSACAASSPGSGHLASAASRALCAATRHVQRDLLRLSQPQLGRVMRATAAAIAAFPSSASVLHPAAVALGACCNVVVWRKLPLGVAPEYVFDAALAATGGLYQLGTPGRALSDSLFAAVAAHQARPKGRRCEAIPEDMLSALLMAIGDADATSRGGGDEGGRYDAVRNVKCAFLLLGWLAQNDPAFAYHAAEQGAARAVVGVLVARWRAEENDDALWARAVWSLSTLVAAGPDRTAAQLLAGGAVEIASEALRRQPENLHLACTVCDILAGLSWTRSARAQSDFCARAARCGVPGLLHDALKRHGASVAYQIALTLSLLEPQREAETPCPDKPLSYPCVELLSGLGGAEKTPGGAAAAARGGPLPSGAYYLPGPAADLAGGASAVQMVLARDYFLPPGRSSGMVIMGTPAAEAGAGGDHAAPVGANKARKEVTRCIAMMPA